jgi:hypothetical protein
VEKVVYQFLFGIYGETDFSRGKVTHHSDGIEKTILDERIGEASAVAAPVLSVAIAHGTKYP